MMTERQTQLTFCLALLQFLPMPGPVSFAAESNLPAPCCDALLYPHPPSLEAHTEQHQLNVLRGPQLSKKKKTKPQPHPSDSFRSHDLPWAARLFFMPQMSVHLWLEQKERFPEGGIHSNACQFPLSAGAFISTLLVKSRIQMKGSMLECSHQEFYFAFMNH